MNYSEKNTLYNVGLVALVAVVAYGSLWYLKSATTEAPAVATPPTLITDPQSLDDAEGVFQPDGAITFTAVANGQLTNYQYSLSTGGVSRFIDIMSSAHGVVAGDHTALALLQDDQNNGIAWIDFSTEQYNFFDLPDYVTERDIVGNSLANAVAYSATNNDQSDTWYELENWDVVIHIPDTDYTKVIEKAAHPQWLVADETLLYVKTDGVYHYDLTTDTETPLITEYQNLTFYDDIAATFNGDEEESLLAFTIPSIGAVGSYTITEDLLVVPINLYYEAVSIFTDPVVHPEGNYIAAMKQNQEVPTIVFFSGHAMEPVKTVALPSNIGASALLDGWFTSVPTFNMAHGEEGHDHAVSL